MKQIDSEKCELITSQIMKMFEKYKASPNEAAAIGGMIIGTAAVLRVKQGTLNGSS